jgi:LmbE family N-acetylglucosaminyl deacetylase
MPDVILSPHLDDAVLSCWHVLTQPVEVVVINVFAGVPAELAGPAWWDEHTGATSSAERVRERIEEDRRALAVAGRTAVNLGFLDEQYRPEDQPLAPLTEQIERLLDPGVRIYAPAAFANHADHMVVRAAALALRAEGFEVSLYADLPHATIRGWPAWVNGKNGPTSKDLASALWEHVLAPTGAAGPAVRRLDAAAHGEKLLAVGMYGTQLQALEDFVGRPLADPEVLGYEVVWPTAPPAPAVQHGGRRRSGLRPCDR